MPGWRLPTASAAGLHLGTCASSEVADRATLHPLTVHRIESWMMAGRWILSSWSVKPREKRSKPLFGDGANVLRQAIDLNREAFRNSLKTEPSWQDAEKPICS